MKKFIRLYESELVSLVKKVIKETNKDMEKTVKKGMHYYCTSSFSPIQQPEINFCMALEKEILSRKKDFYPAFDEVALSYIEKEKENLLNIEIEKLTNDSDIVKNGFEEMDKVGDLLSGNCPNIKNKINSEKYKFFKKYKIYYKIKKDSNTYEYSPINRLNTNYSAISVLITKYFSKKGAFDGVTNINNVDWRKISLEWLYKLFIPSRNFEDIRPEDEKTQNPINPSMEELFNSFFKENLVLNSREIKKSVEDVLIDTRQRGFDTENDFENILVKDKENNKIQDYIRCAKDFGFVDMFLGIDFLVKEDNRWYPVQVKTTATEPTYKIDSLGCSKLTVVEKIGDNFKNW